VSRVVSVRRAASCLTSRKKASQGATRLESSVCRGRGALPRSNRTMLGVSSGRSRRVRCRRRRVLPQRITRVRYGDGAASIASVQRGSGSSAGWGERRGAGARGMGLCRARGAGGTRTCRGDMPCQRLMPEVPWRSGKGAGPLGAGEVCSTNTSPLQNSTEHELRPVSRILRQRSARF
jgi:hypothetical protein